MHKAVLKNRLTCIEWLHNHGAGLKVKNSEKQTPAQLARSLGNMEALAEIKRLLAQEKSKVQAAGLEVPDSEKQLPAQVTASLNTEALPEIGEFIVKTPRTRKRSNVKPLTIPSRQKFKLTVEFEMPDEGGDSSPSTVPTLSFSGRLIREDGQFTIETPRTPLSRTLSTRRKRGGSNLERSTPSTPKGTASGEHRTRREGLNIDSPRRTLRGEDGSSLASFSRIPRKEGGSSIERPKPQSPRDGT